MSASPPTPPMTPPTIAPVSLEPLLTAPDTSVALGVLVDDVVAEADVDVEFAMLVELQCVKVLLFEDVWFRVTWFLKLVLHLSVRHLLEANGRSDVLKPVKPWSVLK